MNDAMPSAPCSLPVRKAPHVSVVIPVLNDAARLKICLEALGRQTYPKDRYEVIIVDNGSNDDVKTVVERSQASGLRSHASGHKPQNIGCDLQPAACDIKFLVEPIRGLHQARNTGIKAAKGEVLAFTDADCIPAPDWIEKGVVALNGQANTGLVGGRVDIFFKDPARPTAVELFEKITAFRQKAYIEKMRFAAPANVFTFRSVIEKAGFFDGTLKSGADVEWGGRVFRAGYVQAYAEDAVVAHPARRTLGELLRKHHRVVVGLYDIRKKGRYTLRGFLIDLKDDWPGACEFGSIVRDERAGGFWGRVKMTVILLSVKAARLYEMVRLRLGGKSKW